MKILVLESKLYYRRSNIIDFEKNFKNATISYNGNLLYWMPFSYFKKYDLIVSTLYQSVANNIVIMKCRRHGVKTLLLSDGIIEWQNLYNNPYMKKLGVKLYDPIFHEYFAVMGRDEKKYLSTNNLTSCIGFIPKRASFEMDKNTQERTMFLITTANNPYMDNEEKEELFSFILSVQKYFIENSIPYKLRIFNEELISLLQGKDKDVLNDVNTSFEFCIDNVLGLITTPSSIILKSMNQGIPTAQLIYRNSPIFLQSGWMLTSQRNISTTIKQMQSQCDERMKFQSSVINSYMDDIGEIGDKVLLSDVNKNGHDDCFNNLISRSRYVLDFEPIIRNFDDILKTLLPKSILKNWKIFVKKAKYRGVK
ncbi:hypothetical protein [Aeromonas caviae]|uniref:hypothetical protein n=1 Tax=Aeromonas caviae TaxID=648 RepID=UPI0029DCE536|nr:hypothetical protein [Aeromonas caviae]MDX7767846.1 hypothetical protein [Aeromonas caviae]